MSARSVTPVIVLSLPRSGSTLVQRTLSAHPGVATTAEPWLLLSLAAPMRPRIPWAGGWHRGTSAALHDLAAVMPGGMDDVRKELELAAQRLYEHAAPPGAGFFIDKTPPYFLVADELFGMLPDARFLFLWRNPLAVVASIVETFCAGRFRPDDYTVSLFTGLANLVAAFERHGTRAVSRRYEDLVTGGSEAWAELAVELGLPFDATAPHRVGELQVDGRFGDVTGTERYRRVDPEPLTKWRATLASPVRRAWARRYLRWIGARRLATMGYDLGELLAELDALPYAPATAAADAADLARSFARDAVKRRLVRHDRGPSAWRFVLGS